ncbi:hypothetical protein ACFRK5_13580 [Streptomyces niveus]
MDRHRSADLTDIGPVPDGEAIIEIPEDVLKYYARRYQQEANRA